MTARSDVERTVGAWLSEEAATTPPPEPLARALETTRTIRPRPARLARIGSAWAGMGGPDGARGGMAAPRPALVLVLVALLLAAFAGAVALVGSRPSSPRPLPARHAYADRLVRAPDLPAPMGAPTLVALLDGRVLVISDSRETNTALLYDPSTGASVAVGPLVTPERILGGAVRLRDGRVFITGDAVIELFDPTTLRFAAVGPPITTRSFPEIVLLPDGRVLVAGGTQPGGSVALQSADLFDPATLTFAPTGPLEADAGRMGVLPDGRVFVASSPTAQIYDPRSGTFADAGVVLPGGVTDATALADGRVAIVGVTGLQSGGYVGVWDPMARRYHQVDAGSHPMFSTTLLDDGRVLVTGGRGSAWAGVLDPGTERVTAVDPPLQTRPASTRLLDGRVLIVGGLETGARSVQIFQ